MSEITPDEVSREVDSNSFQNLVSNTIDEEHAIRVAFEAGIAFACRKQKGECFCGSHNNTFFGKDLISSTVDSPTVPEHLMCENPYCDALHHPQNQGNKMPNEETKNDQESGMDHAFVHDLERNMLAGRRAGKLWRALNIALSVGGRQTVVSPDEASQQMYADRLTKMATKRGLEPMLHYDDDGMYVEWGESKISIRTFEQLRKSAGETVSICSTGPFGKRLPE